MRILLTGASGMVGQNILRDPLAVNHDILTPSRSELNLLDVTAIREYLHKWMPEMIIHAAGRVGGIQANIREPVKFLVENLDMGRNIILSAYEAGVKQFINLGSSCMYPKGHQEPLTEDLILTGQLEPTNEGYALAKTTVARLCQYIMQENTDFQYKTLIPCNLYGYFDKFDPAQSHLIPAIIQKVYLAIKTQQDSVEIWGDGSARREFMFATDLADGIFCAIDQFDRIPDLMNMGTGIDYSILEYYSVTAELLDYKGDFIFDKSKPVGMKRKIVNIDRQKTLDWMPRHSLREGLTKTIEFYLRGHSK